VVVLDAGYFSPPDLAIRENPDGWLGVGHSLGFARLLQMDIPWRGLVGIGGFLRFCQKPGRETGTPAAVLRPCSPAWTRARRTCWRASTSAAVTGSRRCPRRRGRPGLLRADLERLRDLDLDLDLPAPARPVPTLFLQAQDDRIVPLELAREAQALLPGSRLEALDTGGHALPMTRAQDCLRLVREFLHDLG